MKKFFCFGLYFIKFVLILCLVAGFSGVAFGTAFTVTKTADTNDGVCDADCSLREAIAKANNAPTNDVIEFDANVFNSPQTITLLGGEILITTSGGLTINSPRLNSVTISGNMQGRIFNMQLSNIPTQPITLNNLMLAHGSSGASGGAINKENGALVINNSVVRDSTGSTGGGLASAGGNLTITNSTFSGNYSFYSSGAIYHAASQSVDTFTMTNTTVSGNTSQQIGGGLRVYGTTNIINSTIAFNTAREDRGGGIANELNGSFTTLRNTVVANNLSLVGNGPDFSGNIISQGFNLIGSTSGATISGTTAGNLLNVNPLLAPLALNGGNTPTHLLLSGSPAIDTGDPNNVLPTDQRGIPRPLDGDSNGIALSDIGAFEAGAKVVTKIADTNDGTCNGDCSLREAIAAANATPTNDAIVFAPLFNSPQTIVLNGNGLIISNSGSLIIEGTGPNVLTISGNNASGVFFVESGSTVIFNNLKISDGKLSGNGSGGGIAAWSNTNVTINNSVISNNSTNLEPSYTNNGGGIYNNGSMVINNSVISHNSSSGQGGGIDSEDGAVSGQDIALTINNSIISDNITLGNGGGIYTGFASHATLNITNTTVSNNIARFGGGVIIGAAASLTNVTVTNNVATQGYGGGMTNGYSASPLTITDSTISNNSANLGGGGLWCLFSKWTENNAKEFSLKQPFNKTHFEVGKFSDTPNSLFRSFV